MLTSFAVLGISMSELLFIAAAALLLFAGSQLARLPHIAVSLIKEIHWRLNAPSTARREQAGHAEADNS